MDTKFATSFAPYTPAPDESGDASAQKTSNPTTGHARPSWFKPPQSIQAAYSSYQSGGMPSFGTNQAGITGFGGGGDEENGVNNLWETRFGWRVDVLAALAYLLGPVSGKPYICRKYTSLTVPASSFCSYHVLVALALLILETSNDYVRFHG